MYVGLLFFLFHTFNAVDRVTPWSDSSSFDPLVHYTGARVIRPEGFDPPLSSVGCSRFAIRLCVVEGAAEVQDLIAENRFAPPTLERVDGIVVLGGAVSPFLTAARGQPAQGASPAITSGCHTTSTSAPPCPPSAR